jgi:hypothetical protein
MTKYGDWIEYECDLGCQGRECPGHKIRAVYHVTSDTLSFEITTPDKPDINEYIDPAKFKAMQRSYESL